MVDICIIPILYMRKLRFKEAWQCTYGYTGRKWWC